MKYLPQLLEYAESLRDKPMETMIITAHLISPYIPDMLGNIYFDGILSKAVTYKIPCQFNERENYFIPLPILILGNLKKYYCCSVGRPKYAIKSRMYMHKRNDIHVNKKIRIGAGTYKIRRDRYDTIYSDELNFLVHGIKDEIENLLQYITNIGKITRNNMGDIHHWTVETINNNYKDCILSENKVLRPIPISEIDSDSPILNVTYYPPYWHHLNYSDCYIPIFGGI